MVFNDNVLFIHVPKTAGMSLTQALPKSLPGIVNITSPNGDNKLHGKVRHLKGKRHGYLVDAQSFLISRKRALEQFSLILAVTRNPYEMELSRYNYLRLGHSWDKGKAQKLALAGNFEEFAVNAPLFGWNPSKIEYYYTIGGAKPVNMKIVRFENLSSDLDIALCDYIENPLSIPHENKTKKTDYKDQLNKKIEVAIYNKYKWVFDSGMYSRARVS